MVSPDGGSKVPGADIHVSPIAWLGFLALVVALIVIDLVVFHKEDHEISVKEATVESAAWIGIALAFGGVVWWWLGGSAAAQYYTGYVIEKSLSVDNVFVWAVLLGFFAVPKHLQHRVLFWGVFGALVMRAVFIFAGVALLNRLSALILVFGGFLVFTAVRIARHDEGDVHPENNPLLKFMRRRVPMTADYEGHHFAVVRDGKRFATPLLVVLVMVEATDLLFAVDSVPAILAVSRSQFIVFSSNAFAILGLRSLYFMLAGASDRLIYLNKGLGVILFYVGVKMIVSYWDVHLPIAGSLSVIVVVLAVTVWLSLRATRPGGPHDPALAERHAQDPVADDPGGQP
jgi:tellurite resistance protein TerC